MEGSLAAFAWYFLGLGATGFGGPAALADRMRRDLVVDRRWLTAEEYNLGLAIAAACPGPLAYQLAVYCGEARHGTRGALVVALAFAAAPFALVVLAAAAYTQWSPSSVVRGMFRGAAPVVVALVARACWTLGRKTLHRAWIAWTIATAGVVMTWAAGREPVMLFLAAAALGAISLPPSASLGPTERAPSIARRGPAALAMLTGPAAISVSPSAGLFAFFFKTGCLVFGSGLVIVPFLQSGVVAEHHWLNARQFVDAVTIGLVSPGPVVITATFVGYLVNGFSGAVAATTGMFLPAVLFTMAVAPVFRRWSRLAPLQGAVRGVTAAVVGVLAGTVPLIAAQAIPDRVSAVVALVGFAASSRRLAPDPVLVLVGALIGAVASA
jgi:chromate transporter